MSAGHLHKIAGEFLHEIERALGGGLRGQGVQVGEAGQARHFLIETGVVLHGARAQRIKARVDRVVAR